MHELSIAVNLKGIIEEAASRNSCRKVNKVFISVGEFGNVYKESLEFALDVVKKGTVFGDAQINITVVKTKLRCVSCGNEFVPENFIFICPSCGNYDINVEQGQGVILDSIEAE